MEKFSKNLPILCLIASLGLYVIGVGEMSNGHGNSAAGGMIAGSVALLAAVIGFKKSER